MAVFDTLGISGSGLLVHRKWLDAVSDNMANINTVNPYDQAPFRERLITAQAVDYGSGEGGVRTARAEFGGDPEGRIVYEPDHPMANAEGYVRYPDVDLGDQMVQLLMAQRGYQANLAVVERATSAYQAALQLGEALMTSPLGGIVPVGVGAVGSTTSIGGGLPPLRSGEGGDGFAATLAAVFDQLQGTQKVSNDLAVQAATGDLRDVHDYMIASTEAGLATEMVVTIKNKAVEAFNEIMRMPI